MNNKILIVGPSWLGDMIMAQSLFKAIHSTRKNAIIDVLAPDWCKGILARMPEVNNSILMPINHGEFAFFERRRIGHQLKKYNYSEVILLPNSLKSSFIPFFAGIKQRTGWVGEFRYGLLNDVRKLDKTKLVRMVDRFVALAYPKNYQQALQIQNPLLQISQTNIEVLSTTHGFKLEKPVLALCPGAAFGDAKCWPKEHYSEIAKYYLDLGYQVWLFGSKNEINVTQFVASSLEQSCVNFAGKTSLEDAVDLLSLAKVIVSNDSGLMHLGAAIGKPLVALYGPTPEAFAPPLTKNSRSLYHGIECRPCGAKKCPLSHHKCMVDISPRLVINAIKELLT